MNIKRLRYLTKNQVENRYGYGKITEISKHFQR